MFSLIAKRLVAARELMTAAFHLLWRGRLALFPWLLLVPWMAHAVRQYLPRPTPEVFDGAWGATLFFAKHNFPGVGIYEIRVLVDAMALLLLAGMLQSAPLAVSAAWSILRKRLAVLLIAAPAIYLATACLQAVIYSPMVLFGNENHPAILLVDYFWIFRSLARLSAMYLTARLAFVVPLILLEHVRLRDVWKTSWVRTRSDHLALFSIQLLSYAFYYAAACAADWLGGSRPRELELLSGWFARQFNAVAVWPVLDAMVLSATLLIFWRSHIHSAPLALAADTSNPPEEECGEFEPPATPYPLHEFGGDLGNN